MPYSRTELLAAIRADHPEFAKVDDNKLFAAIAIDHPDIAKGISELQAPASSASTSNRLGDTPLGALTMGVDPQAFGNRVLGAAASVINPLLPGGDTKQNIPLPQMTPDQEIGAKTAAVGTAIDPLVGAMGRLLPNAERAGTKFQTIMAAAKDVPLNLGTADDVALRALELGGKGNIPGRGSSLPKVFSDYIRQRQNAVNMPYEVGRDFQSSAGRLSDVERMAANPQMQSQVGQFAAALKQANREGAATKGMGELFDAASKEYRQAMALQDAKDALVKGLKQHMGNIGSIGAGGYAAYKFLR